MPPSARLQLEQAVRITRKWKWYGAIPGAVTLLVCLVYALIIPDSYTASATISVDTDSPTNPLLRDLNVDQRRQERLAVVAEAIHSYAVLEGTVQEVGAGTIVADSPGLVTYVLGSINDRLLRNRPISISQAVGTLNGAVEARQWGHDLIKISYTGLDPAVAAEVTNTVVDRFIQNSSMTRRLAAQATATFIEEQVATYKLRLEESEAQLRAFREQNLEVSPNQFNGQVGALAEAKTAVVATQIQAREVEQRITFLQGQLGETDEKVISERITSANPVLQEIEARLVETRVQLATLRTNYTEKHPEIIRLTGQIADLEAELVSAENTTVTSETAARNPAYESLVQRLQEARIEQESLKLRLQTLQERIAYLEDTISAIPEQEQMLAQLTRDSQVNERVYELLLQRLQEAKISEQLAAQDRGAELFRIIDAARAPEAPSGPNRPFLLAFALVASVGAGCGGVLARHYVDESYDDADKLVEAFALPCLAVIPRLDKAA